jgi:dTDP-4-dehydrorhamnose reductase
MLFFGHDDLETPKIVLISQSGFLGAHLYEGLRRLGFDVVGSSRTDIHAGVSSLRLNLEHPVAPQIANALETGGFQFGILCAAMSDVETCFKHQQESRKINVD